MKLQTISRNFQSEITFPIGNSIESEENPTVILTQEAQIQSFDSSFVKISSFSRKI